MPKKRAERQRKFLEELFVLCENKTLHQAKLTDSAPDFVGVDTGISGLSLRYVVGKHKTRVELYIHRGTVTLNKRTYDELLTHKAEIDDVFGKKLVWEPLDEKIACRIAHETTDIGYKDDETDWQAIQTELIDAMVRLEKALLPFIPELMRLK